MTGLRARQKADRHRRILDAALRQFRTTGYAAARTEDIAAEAGVSVGTLYNYFETKGDLLLALVTLEVEEVLTQGRAVVAAPPPGVAAALARLIGGYYEHSLVYLTKEMWRTAMALTIEAPATPFSARFTALDRSLTDQVCALLTRLQALGHLRADLDTAAMGEVVFHNLNQMFIEFVKRDAMTVDDLLSAVGRHNSLLAALMQARP